MGERRHTFSVGGLRLRFVGRGPEGVAGPFASFLGGRGPIHGHYLLEERAAEPGRQRLLADGGIWRLFEHPHGQRVEFYAPNLHGERPVLQADLTRDWARGIIRTDPEICPETARAAPLATPFGELLLVGLLSRVHGLYVHAASALWPTGADLFLGRSGAGKTTLSGVARRCGAEVLSDDRTVLRFRGGRLWAYGTPFHGTGRRWSSRAAPTRALFFLEQDKQSRFIPLPLREAAARLSAVCFAPFWEKESLESTLRLVEAAVGVAPPYALRFRPDASAVKALDAAAHAAR
jgi:hypothetical protein